MLFTSVIPTYSHLSNSQGGWNKRGGGAKVGKSINVEVGLLQLESFPFVFNRAKMTPTT